MPNGKRGVVFWRIAKPPSQGSGAFQGRPATRDASFQRSMTLLRRGVCTIVGSNVENAMTLSTTERIEQEAAEANEGMAKAGTKLSLGLHKAILAGGEPTRNLADFLHGTWLGHPLHPMLTDLTIGAWTMGSIFDGIAAYSGSESVAKSADYLMIAGTISAVPTAITGMTDFSTIPESAAKTATWHAALNSVNMGLYVWSIAERRRGNRRRGVLLSTIALGMTAASAWLGGHMVYKERVGVNHADEFEGSGGWMPVLESHRLGQREPQTVEVDGKPVLLYREGDAISAIGNTCSHAGGPLNEGTFEGGCVQCPWHDSVFKLEDGSVVHGPATQPQPRFEAREREGDVEIRLVEGQ